MNPGFDGGNGIYSAVMVGALLELSHLWGQSSKGRTGRAWKRAAWVLAIMVAPVALLMVSRLGS